MSQPERGDLTFLQHLEELRWHLVRSVLAILVGMVAAFLNKSFIFDTLIFGPKRTDFLTYRAFCKLGTYIHAEDSLCLTSIPFQVVNLDMAGQFMNHLKVSAILGFVAAFPYIFWEAWRFIKPALHAKERKYTRGVVFFTSILFGIGCLFGYYIMVPFSINFLGSYQVAEEVVNTINLESYVGMISMLVLSSGIIFELPMVVYFLSKIGLLTPEFMRNYRRHAVIIILVVAAVITPPDVTSQILISIPLWLLYEASIFVSARVQRSRESDI